MNLSKELQIGKAGEHLVCCDLIMRGYNAFLADQGYPFDIVVEKNGVLKKLQVRTTTKLNSYGEQKNIYSFSTRRGKNSRTMAVDVDADCYAFVAIDIKEVAYISAKDMVSHNSGKLKQMVCFKTKRIDYVGRVYSNGTVRTPEWGKYFENYSEFMF